MVLVNLFVLDAIFDVMVGPEPILTHEWATSRRSWACCARSCHPGDAPIKNHTLHHQSEGLQNSAAERLEPLWKDAWIAGSTFWWDLQEASARTPQKTLRGNLSKGFSATPSKNPVILRLLNIVNNGVFHSAVSVAPKSQAMASMIFTPSHTHDSGEPFHSFHRFECCALACQNDSGASVMLITGSKRKTPWCETVEVSTTHLQPQRFSLPNDTVQGCGERVPFIGSSCQAEAGSVRARTPLGGDSMPPCSIFSCKGKCPREDFSRTLRRLLHLLVLVR